MGCRLPWRCTRESSSAPGRPQPLTLRAPGPAPAGCKVAAGTVNCDGAMTVRAEHSGKDTAIADIVRLVEQAQARTAPIQRLADTVSGKFAYGVMGLAAATLGFWATVRGGGWRRGCRLCGKALGLRFGWLLARLLRWLLR
jgi:Cu+-exporting ATPase